MEENAALVTDPVAVLVVLLAVLATIFWIGETAPGKRLSGVVPSLLFCYFVPTMLTTLGVLPASLMLLILALDVQGILRLGPKALIIMLSATAGVMIGAPIALWIFASWVPPDTWQGMTALSGSWIGGGANMVALAQFLAANEATFPVYLFSQLRLANRLPVMIALAVLLMMATLALDLLAEWIRRRGHLGNLA